MNTINKHQQFYKTNPAMLYLKSLPDEKRSRSRGYKFRDEPDRCPYANILWGQICRDYKEAGLKEFKVYTHLDANLDELKDNEKHLSHIYIHTSLHETRKPRIEYSVRFTDKEDRVSFTPNSNRELSKKLIIELVISHYTKNFLFPDGVFRGIQRFFTLSKIGAIKKYKALNKNPIRYRHIDVLDYIFDKFNIEVPYFEFDNEDKVYSYCKDWVRKFGKPKETMYLKRFRPLHLLDGFDGNVDEAVELFHECMNDVPSNVILV